ncbi:unnamed protein product [Urochloa humidicola]
MRRCLEAEINPGARRRRHCIWAARNACLAGGRPADLSDRRRRGGVGGAPGLGNRDGQQPCPEGCGRGNGGGTSRPEHHSSVLLPPHLTLSSASIWSRMAAALLQSDREAFIHSDDPACSQGETVHTRLQKGTKICCYDNARLLTKLNCADCYHRKVFGA